jgi:hypothetical protein
VLVALPSGLGLARGIYDDALAAGAGPIASYNQARLPVDTVGAKATRHHFERLLAESAARRPREAKTLRQLLLPREFP